MSQKIKIVIVEDDVDLVEALRIILESKSYEVSVAYDLVTGLSKIRSERPDLIVLDVMFSKGEKKMGFHLANEIRMDKAIASIPILMLTALNNELPGFNVSPETDGEYLPVDAFLNKPAEPKAFLSKVGELLKLKTSPWAKWPEKTPVK